MTDGFEDDPLAALWSETEAPARDAHFELAVEERIARRLLLVDGAGLLVAAGAGATALWGFWPTAVKVLDGLAGGFGAAGPVLAAAAAVSAAAWWLARPRIA
ncbi:MAG: hypothetical protein JSR86_00480 [Proteobacteria bacterium]|nr:hypothetical protein [Pseudomonadota bacterium]